MLELRALSKQFGGVRAVDGLELTVEEGQIFRPDWSQRLRKEHNCQSDLRRVPRDLRHNCV